MEKHTEDLDTQHRRESYIIIKDLLILILKYKWMILAITAVAAIIPLVFNITVFNFPTFRQPVIPNHYAKCTISAEGGNLNNLVKTITSKNFKNSMIENKDFIKALGNIYFDPIETDWRTKQVLTKEDILYLMDTKLTLIPNSERVDTLTLIFYHFDPLTPEKVLMFYLLELEKYLQKQEQERRGRILSENEMLIINMKQELKKSKDTALRNAIASKIAEAMVEREEISVSAYTAFEVIHPPATDPTILQPKARKIEGQKIILLWALLAFFFSIFLAFLIETLRRMNKEYADKIKIIRNLLKLGKGS